MMRDLCFISMHAGVAAANRINSRNIKRQDVCCSPTPLRGYGLHHLTYSPAAQRASCSARLTGAAAPQTKIGELSMMEWSVYADSRYVGSAHAATGEAVRLAALSSYEIPEDAGLSVSQR